MRADRIGCDRQMIQVGRLAVIVLWQVFSHGGHTLAPDRDIRIFLKSPIMPSFKRPHLMKVCIPVSSYTVEIHIVCFGSITVRAKYYNDRSCTSSLRISRYRLTPESA